MTLTRPDPFGLRQCDRALAIVEREIRELRGDEMNDSFGPYEKNPRQKEQQEVMEYIKQEWKRRYTYIELSPITLDFVIKAIMRRYDLFPVEDEPREG